MMLAAPAICPTLGAFAQHVNRSLVQRGREEAFDAAAIRKRDRFGESFDLDSGLPGTLERV